MICYEIFVATTCVSEQNSTTNALQYHRKHFIWGLKCLNKKTLTNIDDPLTHQQHDIITYLYVNTLIYKKRHITLAETAAKLNISCGYMICLTRTCLEFCKVSARCKPEIQINHKRWISLQHMAYVMKEMFLNLTVTRYEAYVQHCELGGDYPKFPLEMLKSPLGGGDPVPNFQNRMLGVLPHLHSKYRTHIGYKLTKFLHFILFCIHDFACKLSSSAQTRRQCVPFSSSSSQLCWTFLMAHSMAR